MTDEELDALVHTLWHGEVTLATVASSADAITTLRAQLADARAERDAMIHPDHVEGLVKLAEPMIYEALAAETARADRAEAALAAQIEVDAEIADLFSGCNYCAVEMCATAIRAQPHDRTALDRYREKVLLEAAQTVAWHSVAAGAILALIEKEKTE